MTGVEIGTIIGGVALVISKDVLRWYKSRSAYKQAKFEKTLPADILINTILDEIRGIAVSNSIHIMAYSNGDFSLNGICFNYMSMTHERTDIHTTPIMMNYQKVPCSPFSDVLDEINEHGLIMVDSDGNSPISRIHRSYDVTTAYKFRIGDSIINGTVTLSYYNRKYTLTESQIGLIKDKILIIERLLKQKKK